jgi:hypothetical protein
MSTQLPSMALGGQWRAVGFEGTRSDAQGVGVRLTMGIPREDPEAWPYHPDSHVVFWRHTSRDSWPEYRDMRHRVAND